MIVVRRNSDNAVVAFGDETVGYQPVVSTDCYTTSSETHAAVAAEWRAANPIPNRLSFEQAMWAEYAGDFAALNTLMAKYPLFLWVLRDENWAVVAQIIGAAVGAGDINSTHYEALRQAALEAKLPMELSS